MKNKLALLFIALLPLLLIPFRAVAQEKELLRNMKLTPEAEPHPAPQFVSVTPEGKKIKMADFKGKVVILNFWATWCPPCRLEMPSMEKLYRDFKGQGLEIVAVNFMEGVGSIKSFVKENGFTFNVLLDGDGKIAQSYGVRALPVTFLIGREGDILARSIGYKDWHSEKTRSFIASFLKDESVVKSGLQTEVKASLWPWEGKGGLLLLGITLLVLLFASVLGFRKRLIRQK